MVQIITESLVCPRCDGVILAHTSTLSWWNLPLARLPGEEFPCGKCGHTIVLGEELRRLRRAQLATRPRWWMLAALLVGCELMSFHLHDPRWRFRSVAAFIEDWPSNVVGPIVIAAVIWGLIEQNRLESRYGDLEDREKG